MMRVALLVFGILVSLSLTVVLAQDPGSPPGDPRTLPGEMPSTPVSKPGSGSEIPLARFEPLSAFPPQTQTAIRGVLLGSQWLTRMNQPQGRFLFGYDPALRQPLVGEHDLKQARGALALAQAAKFCGDEKQAALAGQSILALLAATKLDANDPNSRVPVHSSLNCNRVGFAALLILAIHELPTTDGKLLVEADRLGEFLRKQCRADGSVHYTDGPSDDPTQIDPTGVNEYPGLVLQAIIVSNRSKPATWKTDLVKRGLEYYRSYFKTKPHPLLAASLTPAFAELYLQTKLPEAATAVFEMNDWLCALQIAPTDPRVPQWAGGFRSVVNGQQTDTPPGPETGCYLQSLGCACQLTRLKPDLDRFTKYQAAALNTVQFLCGLQYLESNTRHFENSFRVNMLIGGFYLSPVDGRLRVDATGSAITGLLKFLDSGAEK